MDASLEGIKTDILEVIDKLDTLKADNTTETGFLIERAEDILNDLIRYDLDVIEQAIKKG